MNRNTPDDPTEPPRLLMLIVLTAGPPRALLCPPHRVTEVMKAAEDDGIALAVANGPAAKMFAGIEGVEIRRLAFEDPPPRPRAVRPHRRPRAPRIGR